LAVCIQRIRLMIIIENLFVSKMSERSYARDCALGGFMCQTAKAGLDVHFLLKSDYEYVSKSGLVIESKDGDFTPSSSQRLQ